MADERSTLEAARAGDARAFEALVSPFRRELAAHCYRMTGSIHETDDLAQEVLIRAWKGLAGFEGRASVRTWLHRIATNVCIERLGKREPRLLPRDAGPAGDPREGLGAPRLDPIWLEPCRSELADDVSPDARYDRRQSVALAFLVALQRLPPKQRAVLLMRDVLGFSAEECASALADSVPAVNSALQRARGSVAPPPPEAPADLSVVSRYVEAWEKADAHALVALLKEDATLAMPPFSAWLRGAEAIASAIGVMVFDAKGPGAHRFERFDANGLPAVAMWERDDTGVFVPTSLSLLELDGDRVAAITAFMDARLFPALGFPTAR